MEGQVGRGAEPADEGVDRPCGVPRLGGRVHPRPRVAHPGRRPQGRHGHARFRRQRDHDAMAGQ